MRIEEKREEIWLSPMTKAPSPTEKSKKHCESKTTPSKTSITQQLRTDLGRSVGVTAVKCALLGGRGPVPASNSGFSRLALFSAHLCFM